jgi:predicted nuclease of predicted toxin-antitoxin system
VRILVDMSVDICVADWLRRQGYGVVHLRDEGLLRMPNGEIFEKALSEDRIILTSDLDFGEIGAIANQLRWGGKTVGRRRLELRTR